MMAVKNPKYSFNPLKGLKIPRNKKKEALEEIREYVIEEVLSHVGSGKSPVAKEGWKKTLNKEYKKYKSKLSSSTIANMELEGDMLDALDVKIEKSKLVLKINDESQAGKSDGHNNHSGKSKIPQRRFIPKGKQKFKRDIEKGIKEIALEYLENEREG